MEKRESSLAELQDLPKSNLILLTGPPGAGKSTFCHQAVLNGLAMDRPVIYITTEHGPSDVIEFLQDRGMGEPPSGALSFIDAFGETVGEMARDRPDTVCANCEDLNSISMAIEKLSQTIGKKDILLAFDSLTPPYLFNDKEVFRFMRLCLAKFASKGHSVLALMDEGCGKEEDLGAMMSVADGIFRMEVKERSKTLNVVKHPRLKPARIDIPIESRQPQIRPIIECNRDMMAKFYMSLAMKKAALRREVGDFVNLFWPNLAHWSCMLWDPKGFPMMLYEMNKLEGSAPEMLQGSPWYVKAFMRMVILSQSVGILPNSLDKVKNAKKVLWAPYFKTVGWERSGVLEYLENISRTDEHYFRVYENSDCVGFENIGERIASHVPPMLAGYFKAVEGGRREWNAIETKCLGKGDPYCEFKVVPGEIAGLKSYMELDSSIVKRIHDQLVERLLGFLLEGTPLVNRPRLGSEVHLHVVAHGMGYLNIAGERYRMAQRMGAARSAKKIGERLMDAGLSEDETLKRVIDFMNYCKVGKVTLGETIRISENCETLRTTLFKHREEPSCFFTTGFLNGLFSAVKNKHVREVKCLAAGDPYCEWEVV